MLTPYLVIVRRRLRLLSALALLAAAIALYSTMGRPPIYRTTTTLFLNPAAVSPLLPYQPAQASNGLQSLASTYREVLRTRSFAELVVAQSGAPVSEGEVLVALSAELVPDTQFFRISAVHSNPDVAQRIANTAAEVLIASNVARQAAEQKRLEAERSPEVARLVELRTTLQDEISFYDEQLASLQSQVNSQGGLLNPTDEQQTLLQEQLTTTQQLRSAALTSLVNVQSELVRSSATVASNVDTAVVIDPAPLPVAPERQNVTERLVLAIGAALVLGVGLALLLEYLDDRIRTIEVLETVYEQPILGTILSVPRVLRNHTLSRGLAVVEALDSPVAEAFRTVRTQIQFSGLTTPIRSLLVVSALPGEGRTFVAANLAACLAQDGRKVVLVDADLRQPQLHSWLNLPAEPGFTTMIVKPDQPLPSLLQQTAVANLWLLACGPLPTTPLEMLNAPSTTHAMRCIEEWADIVVYDSPPLLSVTDAAVLATRVSAVIQVVQAGCVRVGMLRRSKALLEKARTPVLGPVLNRVRASDMILNQSRRRERRIGHQPASPPTI